MCNDILFFRLDSLVCFESTFCQPAIKPSLMRWYTFTTQLPSAAIRKYGGKGCSVDCSKPHTSPTVVCTHFFIHCWKILGCAQTVLFEYCANIKKRSTENPVDINSWKCWCIFQELTHICSSINANVLLIYNRNLLIINELSTMPSRNRWAALLYIQGRAFKVVITSKLFAEVYWEQRQSLLALFEIFF